MTQKNEQKTRQSQDLASSTVVPLSNLGFKTSQDKKGQMARQGHGKTRQDKTDT